MSTKAATRVKKSFTDLRVKIQEKSTSSCSHTESVQTSDDRTVIVEACAPVEDVMKASDVPFASKDVQDRNSSMDFEINFFGRWGSSPPVCACLIASTQVLYLQIS